MSDQNTAPRLQVTSAREWRKLRQEGLLVKLPSGLIARLRPVSIVDLWKTGNIPNGLIGLVSELLVNGTVQDVKPELSSDLVSAVGTLYDIVCKSAFVSPRIVVKPSDDEDEIEIEDVAQGDREFVLAWCSTPATELREFRGEQDADVGAVGASKELRG